MVKLTIDNQQIEVKEGTKIIDAAVLAGVRIPRLCFLRDLNEIGACRVCVVEVEGKEMSKGLEKITVQMWIWYMYLHLRFLPHI